MKKILLVHTGGTFGMSASGSVEPLVPDNNVKGLKRLLSELHRLADIDLIVPFTIDSAYMDLFLLKSLARLIYENREIYDGFVLIHGTDTLAYTASALSFMLLNFPKPIILTGAQCPLSNPRSDAQNNLVNAVAVAVSGVLEVAVFFGSKLYRGNRTTKVSTWRYEAFDSPNYPPLGEVGLKISLCSPGETTRKPFDAFFELDPSIIVVPVFPGIIDECLLAAFRSGAKSIIIEGYGAGTVPTRNSVLVQQTEKAIKEGRIVAVNTRCRHGGVSLTRYESAQIMRALGVASCKDMTIESSVVKLMYLQARYGTDVERIKQLFEMNLAGELS
ncbi:MAG: asparaginase [Spirochaetota bacterium]